MGSRHPTRCPQMAARICTVVLCSFAVNSVAALVVIALHLNSGGTPSERAITGSDTNKKCPCNSCGLHDSGFEEHIINLRWTKAIRLEVKSSIDRVIVDCEGDKAG